MTELAIHSEGKSAVAILIETDRAPFVVKNPKHGKSGGGPVSLEVPWREGLAVSSGYHPGCRICPVCSVCIREWRICKGRAACSP